MKKQDIVQIKTGQEVVDDFIKGLKQDDTLDTDVVNLINRLHKKNRLTTIGLTNSLKTLREEKSNEQNKD